MLADGSFDFCYRTVKKKKKKNNFKNVNSPSEIDFMLMYIQIEKDTGITNA